MLCEGGGGGGGVEWAHIRYTSHRNGKKHPYPAETENIQKKEEEEPRWTHLT